MLFREKKKYLGKSTMRESLFVKCTCAYQREYI